MTESSSPKSGSLFDMKWNETNEIPSATEYRTLSIPSLLAFLVGLLSPLVLINWGFVFLPIFALVLAAAGLFGISRSDGMRFGKPLAWSAVFISLCFIVMNVSLWESYKSRVIREAIDFAGSYFEIFAGEPDAPQVDIFKVKDMQAVYWHRSVAPVEDRWKALEKDMFGQEDMDSYTRSLPERTLMALGNRAVPSFYSVDSYGYDKKNNVDYVTLVYAVTYKTEAGEKETFFVNLNVKRSRGEDTTTIAGRKTKMGGWGVGSLRGPILPKEFDDNDG